MEIPEFQTKRLLIRGIRKADAFSYAKHFVDYDVIRHLSSTVPWPYPENGVAEFLRDHIIPNQGIDRWGWGIFLKQKPDELIGCIELWRPGTPENRGFWLGREYWGKGIMTEAVVPVTDAAFNNFGFETLVFTNALGNTRSRRIKEKTRAQFLRTEPARFVDPAFTHHEIWELSKVDWQAASGPST